MNVVKNFRTERGESKICKDGFSKMSIDRNTVMLSIFVVAFAINKD